MTLAGESVRGSVRTHAGLNPAAPRHLVKFASDCDPCELCGEPWCEEHGEHYSECGCVGPTQDDEYDYEEEGDKLYAVKKSA